MCVKLSFLCVKSSFLCVNEVSFDLVSRRPLILPHIFRGCRNSPKLSRGEMGMYKYCGFPLKWTFFQQETALKSGIFNMNS